VDGVVMTIGSTGAIRLAPQGDPGEEGGSAASIALAGGELRRRARRIAFVLSDVDGVWTDAGVYYSDAGEALKRFSIRDGMGVERLRDAGVETGIVTGETSPAVLRRAEKLDLRFVFMGVKDKRAILPDLLRRAALAIDQLAYIGDDHNDLELLEAIGARGLTAAPADAIPDVARATHFRTVRPGGHGAFRDFAEWLLSLRERGDT
jgi:3-deoxy-D-manno-octulosonate 8-phosphate phosphatase (KDO 8-P phosphatase)